MANVFLHGEDRDIETAILLDQAIVHDIGKAIAFTDGKKVFINTEDNLYSILPDYNHKFLKWVLWHENFHKMLSHHPRYFDYLKEIDTDKFGLTHQEVNIIMDILVHDSLSKMFPDLVEIAQTNLAQMRNHNSLKYTFETFTLEEMLDEYKAHKKDKETEEGEDGDGGSSDKDSEKKPDKPDETKDGKHKTHSEGGGGDTDEPVEDTSPEDTPPKSEPKPEPEHDKTDWSKLEDIDDKEFITENESDAYMEVINRLKRTKLKLTRLTETINGLATSQRRRTYSMPSSITLTGGAVLKGSVPTKAQLYLCFDASGSMSGELNLFKDIISKSIPQAMEQPCEWFTSVYGKGKFKDIMKVRATSGFDDDGDRTIELCWKAEQLGYSPIGVTDGGGHLSWSRDKLKQLKRTILVGQNPYWLEQVREVNPRVQTIHI